MLLSARSFFFPGVGNKEGDARLGENPPDDGPEQAGACSSRTKDEGDTPGVSAGV